MKKKKIVSLVIFGVLATVVFLGIQFIRENDWIGNPYLLWNFRSVYSLGDVSIRHHIDEDGLLHVHETISYSMRKPFRLLYRDLPAGRYSRIKSFEVWTEGIDTQRIQYLHRSPQRYEVEVWLVPYNSSTRLDPATHPTVTLHVRYTISRTLERGQDAAQFFPLYWGKRWDAPLENMQYSLTFPAAFDVRKVFAHPPGSIRLSTIDAGRRKKVEIQAGALPPFGFAESRVVFHPLPYEPEHSVANLGLTWSAIQKEESSYTALLWMKRLLPFLILAGYWVLILLIYKKMGAQPKIAYQGIYERELPTGDAPSTVNVIVKNIVGNLDSDGIGATIMNLYRLGAVDLTGEKNPAVVIRATEKPVDLPEMDAEFLSFIKEYAQDGVFDFDALKKQLKKSTGKAKAFTHSLQAFEKSVKNEAVQRKFFQGKGSVLSKLLATLIIILAAATPTLMTLGATSHLLKMGLVFSYLFWVSGLVVFLMPKVVFGKWSPEGLVYFRKWRNFRNFLTDFSNLSEHPPQSVVLWEEFLVYATALGVADQVRESLQKLVPRSLWQEQSRHPYFYTMGPALYASHFQSVRSVAYTSANPGGSGGGGFSGGAGGAGGGFGGGGGGAR